MAKTHRLTHKFDLLVDDDLAERVNAIARVTRLPRSVLIRAILDREADRLMDMTRLEIQASLFTGPDVPT